MLVYVFDEPVYQWAKTISTKFIKNHFSEIVKGDIII